MDIIINPKQVELATVRIKCGSEYGTGFLISEDILLTARHVILDHIEEANDIIIEFEGVTSDGSILTTKGSLIQDGKAELDIALIKIDYKSANYLPLSASKIRYNIEWETYGYPYNYKTLGSRFAGIVSKTNSIKPYDLELKSDNVDIKIDYRGLSGSCLIVEGKVIGVVIWSIVNGLGAVSISKIRSFLDQNEINYQKERKLDDIPIELISDLEDTTPNANILRTIKDKLAQGGKYYLLSGSPGSGKTLISADLKFEGEARDIIGKYFIRIPNDPRPLAQRTSKENFLGWIEDIVNNKLYGEIYPKQSLAYNERITRLSGLLNEVNTYYSAKGQIGFIIIDGLDDIAHGGQDALLHFLNVLPENLLSNISVLLSIAREELLPPLTKASIEAKNIIKVLPLALNQCVGFVNAFCEKNNIELRLGEIQKVAEKSEGHPLYLKYLLEIVKVQIPNNIEEWLHSLPSIGGDISKYYEQIWNTDLSKDDIKLWISLTISQLRQSVKRDALIKMLPATHQTSFVNKFNSIKHLVKENPLISSYHSSFSLFLESKAFESLKLVHDNIGRYCDEDSNSEYAITNCVYHKLRSSDAQTAIRYCNQKWADNCALISVEPDLVLRDIRDVEIFCIDDGKVTELIRVKLLLQRMRFRYDNVIAANAYQIANTLLSIGFHKEALRYILRGDLLLVANDDALYFLQKFYEAGATSEAALLLFTIRKRYQLMYDRDLENDYIEFSTFTLHFNSITLSTNEDYKMAGLEYMNGIRMLNRMISEEKNKENIKTVKRLKDYLSSWNIAYLIWRFNKYPAVKGISDLSKIKLDKKWAGHMAMISICYHEFRDNANSLEKKVAYDSLISDIEYLLENYGYLKKDIEIIISALLETTRKSAILVPLITKHVKKTPSFLIRKPNGVTPNGEDIVSIIRDQMYRGYINLNNDYPEPFEASSHTWEEFLISALKLIGFCQGKGCRANAENNLTELTTIESRVKRLFEALNFKIDNRMNWDRSYALPEYILPIIYQKIVAFYIDFAPTDVPKIVKGIIDRCDAQLGIYTEGYIKGLNMVASLLAKNKAYTTEAYEIINRLYMHILKAVQNRWERTPNLLRVSELFAIAGRIDKAKEVYKVMLDSSMGPSWYKEDQFALINTALEQPLVKGNELGCFKKFAALLESASGEMTFQRFVRYEKEGFIGSMVSAQNSSNAIDYFKHELFPDPSTIIKNAESSTVDAPRKGDGYVLGAKSITEPNGIINLILEAEADPRIIWALSEVFLINDDISRHIYKFASIHARFLDKDEMEAPTRKILYDRVILVAKELEQKEQLSGYLDGLKSDLSETNFKKVEDTLFNESVAPELFKQLKNKEDEEKKPKPDLPDDAFDKMLFPGMGKNFRGGIKRLRETNESVLDLLNAQNIEKARKLLIESLKAFHSEGSDVWMGRSLSNELGESLNLLPKTGTNVELMLALKEFIINHHTNDWLVINRLIKILQDKFTIDDTIFIVNSVKEHFEFIVVSDDSYSSNYNWMDAPVQVESENDKYINLLIWLLNHPHISVKKRVVNSLVWLAEVHTKETILNLIKHALSNDRQISRELAAFVLLRISKKNPQLVWFVIDENPDIQKQIIETPHFMIRHYFREVAVLMNTINDDTKAFFKKLDDTIPEAIILGTEVIFDEPFLMPVNYLINALNDMNLLNRSVCESIKNKTIAASAPVSVVDSLRVQRYIKRSFHEEEIYFGTYDYLLRNSINESIVNRVSKANYNNMVELLELPFENEI